MGDLLSGGHHTRPHRPRRALIFATRSFKKGVEVKQRGAVFSALVLIVFFLSGCLRVPALPDRPDRMERKSADNQGWTELVEGVRLYEAGRYPEAARRFLHIIESYPGSPLLTEAQWLLAKSYLADGRRESAVRELRHFLENNPKGAHETEARALLFRLVQSDQKTVAATWSPDGGLSLEEAIRAFEREGANAVVIPSYGKRAGHEGLYYRSSTGPLIDDRLQEWIDAAHRVGFRVIVEMPIRRMPWAFRQHPEWRDRQYDVARREIRSIEKLDLFQAEVKEGVLQLYRDLAAYPIDAIYIPDLAYGIGEGWSPSALRDYETLFLELPQPEEIYGERVADPVSRPSDRFPPRFWHWVGWRSRYLSGFLKDLQGAVRPLRPDVRWMIGLPDLAVTDPIEGLSTTSIDLLDLKRTETDFYIFLPDSNRSETEVLLRRLTRYAIEPRQIWLGADTTIRLSELLLSPVNGVFFSPR